MNKINRVIVKAVAVLVAIVGVLNIIDYIYAATSVDASTSGLTASATINPSATVSISSGTVPLDIVPSASGTFKESTALTINTYTNTTNTCTVTMTATSTSLNYTDDNSNTYTIDSLTPGSTYTQASFENDSWGYRVGSGNFNPVATGEGANAIGSVTNNNTGNTNPDTSLAVFFAAKLTPATKPGTYTNTVSFASTCEPAGGGGS